MRGDLSAPEEEALVQKIKSSSAELEELLVFVQTRQHVTLAFDELFTKLKQVTGAVSMDAIVEKFRDQYANRASLEKEKAGAEKRLAKAKAAKAEAMDNFLELKSLGSGGAEVNRELYNRLDTEISQSRTNLKLMKAATDRLDLVISGVQQGISNLGERLSPYVDDAESSLSSSVVVVPVVAQTSSGNEHVDRVSRAEVKLSKMLELIGQSSSNNTTSGTNTSNANNLDQLEEEDDDSWSAAVPLTNHENNLRVRPTSASHLALVTNMHHPATIDTPVSARSTNEPHHSIGGSLTLSSTNNNNNPTEDEMDEMVPTRQFLKKSSNRQFDEVVRKQHKDDMISQKEGSGGGETSSHIREFESNQALKQQVGPSHAQMMLMH